MKISLKKLRQELKLLNIELTERDETYKGNDFVKTYIFGNDSIEIEYYLYENEEKSYFIIKIPSSKIKFNLDDNDELLEKMEETKNILHILKLFNNSL